MFIKKSADFIRKIHDLHLDDRDLLVSFNIVLLFTKILVPESLDIIFKLADFETLILIKIYLTSTFFSFMGKFYEQTEDIAMGSLLSPVVVDICMEHFKALSLNNYHLKPKF